MTVLKQRMLDDLRIRNYAPSTVDCYLRSVTEFAKHFKRSPENLGPEEIREWQLYLLKEKRVKLSTYIQAVCALRFFYRNTLNRKIELDRILEFVAVVAGWRGPGSLIVISLWIYSSSQIFFFGGEFTQVLSARRLPQP